MSIQVGDKAPDFSLPDDAGNTVSLQSLRGKRVVLYFYPKADTPGCTTESCEFRDEFPRFEGVDAVILGASPDTVKAQAKFKEKFSFPFALLADKDHSLAESYGVWKEKSMPRRNAFVFFWVSPEGAVDHVEESLPHVCANLSQPSRLCA